METASGWTREVIRVSPFEGVFITGGPFEQFLRHPINLRGPAAPGQGDRGGGKHGLSADGLQDAGISGQMRLAMFGLRLCE
jgi:hypothetical protein